MVEVGFDVPRRQRRLTVAFRLILLIPHFIVVTIFDIMLFVSVVVSWFVALVLGRIPEGAASFNARTIQYVTRVYAYGFLLTDRYPPFGLSRREYPLTVTITSGKLNRLAVLFRLVLQIPAYFVLALVGAGLNVALVFVWLVVLVAGTMPASLYQAIAATLRFQVRFVAYMTLTTSTYPADLFGDRPEGAAQPDMTVTPEIMPPPTTPEEPIAEPIEEPATGSGPASTPLATTLLLTKAAKRILVLFIVLGALTSAGGIAYQAVVGPRLGTLVALDGPYRTLSDATKRFQIASADCQQKQDFRCEQDALRTIAAAFDRFTAAVRGIDFPADAKADAQSLESAADAFTAVLRQAASASTEEGFASYYNQIPGRGATFDTAYARLHDDLI